MKRLLLTGVALLALASLAHADELCDNPMCEAMHSQEIMKQLCEDGDKDACANVKLGPDSAKHADVLPDSLLGHWKENPIDDEHIEQNVFLHTDESVGHGSYYGYDIWKDKYEIYDYTCKILHVEKQMDTVYTVQSYCTLIADENSELKDEAYTDTSEFELLKNGKLLITPVGS
jgi:hypothetical protein